MFHFEVRENKYSRDCGVTKVMRKTLKFRIIAGIYERSWN